MVWDQYSPILQASMESLSNHTIMHCENCSFKLLKEINDSIYKFENLANIHESMSKAKEVLDQLHQEEQEINNDYRKRYNEQIEMLENCRDDFGKNEVLILNKHRREGTKIKDPKRDCAAYKKLEINTSNGDKEMVPLRKSDKRRYDALITNFAN